MKLNAFKPDWLIYMPKILSASDDSYKEAYVEIPEQLIKLEIKNKLFISSTRVFNGYKISMLMRRQLPTQMIVCQSL